MYVTWTKINISKCKIMELAFSNRNGPREETPNEKYALFGQRRKRSGQAANQMHSTKLTREEIVCY